MKAIIRNPARDRLWTELRNKQIEEIMKKVRQLNSVTTDEPDYHKQNKLEKKCKICERPSDYQYLLKSDKKKISQLRFENQFQCSSRRKHNIFDSIRCFEKFCDEHESEIAHEATAFFRKFPGAIQQFFSRSIVWDQMPVIPILRCIEIILKLCYFTDLIDGLRQFQNKDELENPLLQNGLTHEILTDGLIPMLEQKIQNDQEFLQIKETLSQIRCFLVKQFSCNLVALFSKEDFYLILSKVASRYQTVDSCQQFWIGILEKISNKQKLQLMELIIENEILQKRNQGLREQIFTKTFRILLYFLDCLSYLQFSSYLKRIAKYFNDYVRDKPLRNIYNENQLIRQLMQIYGKCQEMLGVCICYDEINREIMIQEVSQEMQIEEPDFYNQDLFFID